MNNAYKSLIVKNNEYITNKFVEMQQICDHSAICLLNIIFSLVINLHTCLDQNKFNTSSYEIYMSSLRDKINDKLIIIKKKLPHKLSHTCNGIDIATCDPNINLFDIK